MKPSLGGPIDGTMAAFMCLSEEGVVKAPAYLGDLEAATLPCAALTAWSALVTYGAVRAGEHVLIQGSGGVALFALAFAKLAGTHVTVISSSDEKIERLKTLGASEVSRPYNRRWVVMQAPTGQRFCVVRLQPGHEKKTFNEWP